MITAIVEFALPQPVTVEEARQTFLSTAPKYLGMPGLVRKYYFRSEDGRTAGGIYLWRSKDDALAAYTDEWKAFVRGKYGSDPRVTFLDCPVVVDNLTHEILSA
jgi:hypothetical protein